jgi:hypothetical protein
MPFLNLQAGSKRLIKITTPKLNEGFNFRQVESDVNRKPIHRCSNKSFAGWKASDPPEDGWTAESFKSAGAGMIRDYVNLYRTMSSDGLKPLFKFYKAYLNRGIDEFTRKVERAGLAGNIPNQKAEVFAGALEAQWAESLKDVFGENANIQLFDEALPKYQSTIDRSYSKSNILLGEGQRAGVNQALLNRANGMAAQVTGINGTTRSMLNLRLQRGVEKGLTVREMVQDIRATFPQFNTNRAMTIARTELGRAADAGVKQSFKDSESVTHYDVIGCEKREPRSPTYRGESTCNIDNVPVEDADLIEFHPNHTGAMVPSRFRSIEELAARTEEMPPDESLKPTPRQEDSRPKKVSDIEVVKPLGGSTGAQLVRDRLTGQNYVMKRGDVNPAQLRSEFQAEKMYRAAGVEVPPSFLIDDVGIPVKLSEYIEDGQTLKQYLRTASVAEAKAIKAKINKDYSFDALMGNWDVIGAELDNIIIKGGKVYRIDQGGALSFRAQGAPKGAAWSDEVSEIWSLRDPKINPSAAEVFKDSININRIARQYSRVKRQRKSILNSIDDSTPEGILLKEKMIKRFDSMAETSSLVKTMALDSFRYSYIDKMTIHRVNIRNAGVVDRMPSKIAVDKNGSWVDGNGVKDDNMKGDSGTTALFDKYVADSGIKAQIVSDWADSQAGSSWSYNSAGLKYFWTRIARNKDASKFYWKVNQPEAKKIYAGMKQYNPDIEDAFAAQHAFTYELLGKAEFASKTNNLKNKTLQVIRTEDRKVMDGYSVNIGKDQSMIRGAHESGSVHTAAYPVGSNSVTVQTVPHHRITTTYFQDQKQEFGRRQNDFFYGDRENEITWLTDGIKFSFDGNSNRPSFEF